jgi:hypothetical protein
MKANLAFDKLQAMRNASKTGGALGNVSNEELALLSSTVASLNIGDPKVLRENIRYVTDIVNNVPGAGKKYLEKIHNDRVAYAKANGLPPPEDPPSLENGGTLDNNAAPATAPPPDAKVRKWTPN